jgi:hypothetical protein
MIGGPAVRLPREAGRRVPRGTEGTDRAPSGRQFDAQLEALGYVSQGISEQAPTELALTGLRCIDRPELETLPGLAWVWGDSGSGKTTLFEAMPLAGRGRLSFIEDSSGLKQPDRLT